VKLSAATTIRRAPDDVFAYLANRTNLPEWALGVGSVRKLTKGAVDAGARFRIEGKLAGRVLPSVYEITEYEPGSRLSGRNTGLMSFTETYELAAAPEGTEVRQQAEVKLGGHMLFLSPLLRLALASQLKKDFANLKRVLEGMPVAAPAGSQAAAD
jgi:carbon monoxide dehydrogenase subunit G